MTLAAGTRLRAYEIRSTLHRRGKRAKEALWDAFHYL
jgi:hypothetical protein